MQNGGELKPQSGSRRFPLGRTIETLPIYGRWVTGESPWGGYWGTSHPPTCRLIIQIGSPESTPASPIFDPHLKPLHSPVRPSLPAPLSPSNGRTKSLKASISWNLRDARCFNSARSFVDRWPHPQPLHCAALGGHYCRNLQKSTQHCRNLLEFRESQQERVQAVGVGGGGHPAKVAGRAGNGPHKVVKRTTSRHAPLIPRI